MFHAISARLARLARRPASRLAIPFEYAARYGWTARRVSRGTWAFRDPRFDQLVAASSEPVSASRSWPQAALTDRIRTLGSVSRDSAAGRGA